jgi:hypothetical protein
MSSNTATKKRIALHEEMSIKEKKRENDDEKWRGKTKA